MKNAKPGTAANGTTAAVFPAGLFITPRRRHEGPPNGIERREVMYSGRHDYLPHDANGRLLPGAHQGAELKKPRKEKADTSALRFEIAPNIKSHRIGPNGAKIFPVLITREDSGKLGNMTQAEIVSRFGSAYLRVETQKERLNRLNAAAQVQAAQVQNVTREAAQVMPRQMTIQDFAERFLTAYENQAGLMREILSRLDARPQIAAPIHQEPHQEPTQAHQEPQEQRAAQEDTRRINPGKRAVDKARATILANGSQVRDVTRAAPQMQAAQDDQEPETKVSFIDVNDLKNTRQIFAILRNYKAGQIHIFGTGDINREGAQEKIRLLTHNVKTITPSEAAEIRGLTWAQIKDKFDANNFVVIPLSQGGKSVKAAINAQAQTSAITDLDKLADNKRMNVRDRNQAQALRACLETDAQWNAAKMQNRELNLQFGDHSAKFKRLVMDAMRKGMPTREANNYAAKLAYGDKAAKVII